MATDKRSVKYLEKKYKGKRIIFRCGGVNNTRAYQFGIVTFAMYGCLGGESEDGTAFYIDAKRAQLAPKKE